MELGDFELSHDPTVILSMNLIDILHIFKTVLNKTGFIVF